jgi:7,8-dihydropterin-6-yl-methyl-4-(beta-D-ribofuranosyl)aminobenzene 5'-phosphate synthase
MFGWRRLSRAGLALCAGILLWSPAPAAGEGYFRVVYDVTATVENGYRTDFGYGVYIEYDGVRLLVDTGTDPEVLAHNLKAAGVDPRDLHAVVLTHNHPDHAGGLPYIRRVAPQVPLYGPPDQDFGSAPVLRVEDSRQFSANVLAIRTHTDRPTVGISDELSVVIRTARGPYLITACSHTGLLAIVDKARQVSGEDVYFYTGGARLKLRPEADTEEVARGLQARRVTHVSPGHCNVDHRVASVWGSRFGEGFVASRIGAKVTLTAPAVR